MKDIIFISDGYGEDTIAGFIIETLCKKQDKFNVYAFPLVGVGKNYNSFNIPLVGPRKELPSGGDLHSFKRILGDLRAGLLSLLWSQYCFLKNLKESTKLVVAVGDIYPVLMAAAAGLRPVIFMGTAKSSWYYPYNSFEKFILKRFCNLVFTRDFPTSQALVEAGVIAKYAGNPMMDCFHIRGEDFGFKSDDTVIAILPGSRDVAYKDFPVILDGVEELFLNSDCTLSFIAALASSTVKERLLKNSPPWKFFPLEGTSSGVTGFFKRGDMKITVVEGNFGDVINRGHIVIGQAGTGNEQAAGLGKPIVAFDSHGGKKLGWYRGRQKGLLGDALSVVEPSGKALAGEILNILMNKSKMEYMSKCGKERMGLKGCIDRLTDDIVNFL